MGKKNGKVYWSDEDIENYITIPYFQCEGLEELKELYEWAIKVNLVEFVIKLCTEAELGYLQSST